VVFRTAWSGWPNKLEETILKGLSVAISLLFAMLLGLFPALVQAATGDIVSVAPGTLTLSAPAGVAVDSLGNLYIADSSNNRVLMVAAGTGTVSTVGASANLSLGLNHPSSVAVDSTGAIYINDGAINHRVLKVAADGQSFGTVAGLTHPYNIAVDSADNLYVADFNDNIVQMVAADGTVSTVAGTAAPVSGDGGQATSAQLFGPINVALDSDGNLYITEYFHNTVRMVTNVDHGNLIYTVAGNTLQGFSGDGGPAASARLSLGSSSGLALDAKGNLYIADTGNNRVRKVSAVASLSGTMTTVAGTGVAGASGDNGPALAAQLNQPYAVALDASGNLYISDRGNNKVRKVVDLPVVTASSPGGTFSAPQNVTLSSNKPATIYYTVDSSTPTTGSPVFPAQGLTIGANTTLTYFAVDASGNQSAPATLGFVVLPGAPGNVQATSGNAFATVSFSAPGFSAGSPITSYTVTSNPGNISASGSASPVTVTGLTNGTTYSFTVTASNGINNSPASAASNSVTPYLLTLSIGAPSKSFLKQGDSVSFVVSYVGATGITLGSGDVTLNTTGTASGSVAVSGTGTLARSVTISNVTGNGSLGISIASGTATGGPLSAAAAGPSATSTVDSAAPTLAVATLGGNTTTSNNTLRVTGSVLDADGIASVTLNGVSQTLTGGAFNSALALSPGANLISVVATDLAGNQTSDIRTISYDPTAPLVGFAAATPADGSSTDQQAATVAGTLM